MSDNDSLALVLDIGAVYAVRTEDGFLLIR